MAWTIREPVGDEAHFIVDSWLESFRRSHFAGPFPMSWYRETYFGAIREIIGRPGAMVRVATVEEVPDLVIGYAVAEHGRRDRPCLHYVYVKREYRRMGCAGALLPAVGIPGGCAYLYTFRTPWAAKLAQHSRQTFRGATWDPDVARYRPQGGDEDGRVSGE